MEKFKEKKMLLTSHNLEAIKLKKKLEALPPEKLSDVQKRFLANEANGEIITIRDVQEAKRVKAEADKVAMDKADIEAAAQKLLDERKAKVAADKSPKVKHGKKSK